MKKILFAAAAFLGMLYSCSGNDDTTPERTILNNIAKYGKRSSTVNVSIGNMTGFMASRGCDVNGNMWEYMPDYPTDAEKKGIMDYIKTNPGGVSWPGYTFYYIQHVDGAHNMYSYVDWNGTKHDNIDGTASMEFMQVLENSGSWQHVYNFNAGKCDNGATNNCALMTDGFNGAKTLNEYSSSTIQHWRLFYWEGNYYLGFDFDAKKGDGEIPGDGIYDDWVVKIIPGKGETPVKPSDPDDPTKPVEPVDPVHPAKPEVEVDIHHQDHKNWNEIKTSIHLRDTVNVRVFIPVDQDYQLMPDDFDIRTGDDYTYITQEIKEVIKVNYTIAEKEFEIDVQVNHKSEGIEVLLAGADSKEALRYARGIYADGITFEIHSYIIPTRTPQQLWEESLSKIQVPGTSLSRWPSATDHITHTHGQIHSAYSESYMITFGKE